MHVNCEICIVKWYIPLSLESGTAFHWVSNSLRADVSYFLCFRVKQTK